MFKKITCSSVFLKKNIGSAGSAGSPVCNPPFSNTRVIFQSARRIKSFFPYKDMINRSPLKCQKLYIRLVVETTRISTLEKRNVDCMTEKLNILKVLQVEPRFNEPLFNEVLDI